MGEKTVLTIESMKKEDLDKVLAIEQASFSQPWSRNLFLSEFRSVTVSTLLVALAGDPGLRRVAGYIVSWNVEDEMHILNLAVAPAFRRRGIARSLVLSAVRRGNARGAQRAFLEVRASNTAAQKLYSSLGFTGSFTRRDYYDDPVEDAVVMTLEQGALQNLVKNEKKPQESTKQNL
jgi:ribosomal-protein-alanine N-acetyltransferase